MSTMSQVHQIVEEYKELNQKMNKLQQDLIEMGMTYDESCVILTDAIMGRI